MADMGVRCSVHAARRRFVTRARSWRGEHPPVRRRVRHARRLTLPGAGRDRRARTRVRLPRAHRFRHAIDGFAARLTAGRRPRTPGRSRGGAGVPGPQAPCRARAAQPHGETVPTGVARIGGGGSARSPCRERRRRRRPRHRHRPLQPRSGRAAREPTASERPGPPEDDRRSWDVRGRRHRRAERWRGGGRRRTGNGAVCREGARRARGRLRRQVICGIDWVTANARRLGIRVANMSLSQVASGRAPSTWP